MQKPGVSQRGLEAEPLVGSEGGDYEQWVGWAKAISVKTPKVPGTGDREAAGEMKGAAVTVRVLQRPLCSVVTSLEVPV